MYCFIFLERAYNEQKSEFEGEKEGEEKLKRSDLYFDDLSKRINQVAVSDDTSSLSTRDRANSDASLDLSIPEGDLGDMEDNQPDSSAPEDEQTDHSTQQPIGKVELGLWKQIGTKEEKAIRDHGREWSNFLLGFLCFLLLAQSINIL